MQKDQKCTINPDGTEFKMVEPLQYVQRNWFAPSDENKNKPPMVKNLA